MIYIYVILIFFDLVEEEKSFTLSSNVSTAALLSWTKDRC